MSKLNQLPSSEWTNKKNENDATKHELSDVLDISQFLNKRWDVDPKKFAENVDFCKKVNVFWEEMLMVHYKKRVYILNSSKQKLRPLEHWVDSIEVERDTWKKYLIYKDKWKSYAIDKYWNSPIWLEQWVLSLWPIDFWWEKILFYEDGEKFSSRHYLYLLDTRIHKTFNENSIEAAYPLEFGIAKKRYLPYKWKDERRYLMDEDGASFPWLEKWIWSKVPMTTLKDEKNEFLCYRMPTECQRNTYLRSIDGTLMPWFEDGRNIEEQDLDKLKLLRFWKNLWLYYHGKKSDYFLCIEWPFAGKMFPWMEKWFYGHRFYTIYGKIFMSYGRWDTWKKYLVSEDWTMFSWLENWVDQIWESDEYWIYIEYVLWEKRYVISKNGEVIPKDKSSMHRKTEGMKETLNDVFGKSKIK